MLWENRSRWNSSLAIHIVTWLDELVLKQRTAVREDRVWSYGLYRASRLAVVLGMLLKQACSTSREPCKYLRFTTRNHAGNEKDTNPCGSRFSTSVTLFSYNRWLWNANRVAFG
ncbi:hypothetical protein TNCV_395251 [Trichonephila clavipes]|nr:hypothetical protein TNCV_395251 [Trichonephila clavipes]